MYVIIIHEIIETEEFSGFGEISEILALDNYEEGEAYLEKSGFKVKPRQPKYVPYKNGDPGCEDNSFVGYWMKERLVASIESIFPLPETEE